MSRFLRWAWNGLAALSLLLCAAALVAWPATHHHGVGLYASHAGTAGPTVQVSRGVIVEARAGVACVRCGDERDAPSGLWLPAGLDGSLEAFDGEPGLPSWWRSSRGPYVRWSAFGAGAVVTTMEDGGILMHEAGAVAPLWAWVLLFALLPGWRAVVWCRRRRKHRVGPAFEVVRR